MCLYPKLIKNRKYIANKKNGGNVPPVSDLRVMTVPVGCGKCIECKKQKSREWSIRLQEEIRHMKNGKFVTLTFSEESLVELGEDKNINTLNGYNLDNGVATLAVRRLVVMQLIQLLRYRTLFSGWGEINQVLFLFICYLDIKLKRYLLLP